MMSSNSIDVSLTSSASHSAALAASTRWRWLPPIDSWRYHALLIALGVFVLGPLGGVTASYMNFSLGFFVGGQVLAGILGSTVTYGYGIEGKHGANYMQTAASSVAGMSGMGVLIQAMVWMGLPQPPLWQLIIYMLCIGMLGAGVGMLYTPILVDKLQLTYPSGLAVANILRALTDPVLLRRSVSTLGSGIAVGLAGSIASAKVVAFRAIDLSTSSFGAGMVVGARIGLAAVMAGITGVLLVPHFTSIGWLHAGDPPRKIMFLIALGTIMGAALIDLSAIGWQTAMRLRGLAATATAVEQPDWKRFNTHRLVMWIVFWGVGVIATGHLVLGQPIGYLLLAVGLVFVFAMVNGISLGISDSNPISSAFVVSVVLMAAVGLKDPIVGLMAGMVLLISATIACDMQQDRSTGWRLGTNRVMQFRYQVIGISVGAVLSVVFAKLFMTAYPALLLDQTVMTAGQQPAAWSAAMTYKFVGVLRSLTEDKPYQRTAIWIGVGIGFGIELLRKLILPNPAYRRFVGASRLGFAVDFVLESIVLPSPYAWSFGGFVSLHTSLWFGAGGMVSSAIHTFSKRPTTSSSTSSGTTSGVPEDMSGSSLFGGGLIAGDALAALGLGLAGLFETLIAR